MRTTMIGDDHDNSGEEKKIEEKSMRAELKGERFVTHVNLSENSTMTTSTTTSQVSHIYRRIMHNESESVAINPYMHAHTCKIFIF